MRTQDLMGLGVPAEQARRQSTTPTFVTGVGASQASAFQIGGDQYLVVVTASSASGNGVSLPSIGGLSGCYLGDDFIINNQAGGSLTVYAPSGFSISISGSLTTGATGVTVSAHTTTAFYPLSTSTWLGLHGS